MTCDEIEGVLADYLGGELSEADRRRFDEHLAGCARCRVEVDSLRGPQEELASLPEIDLAEAARRTSGLEVRPRSRRGRTILAWAGSAAAALFLGVLVGRLMAPAQPAQTPPPPQATGVHPGWVKAASHAFSHGTPPSVPPW